MKGSLNVKDEKKIELVSLYADRLVSSVLKRKIN